MGYEFYFVSKSSFGQTHFICLVAWSKGKTHGWMYHMGIYIYPVANIFEAEQHLTKWTSDLNIPYKKNLLNCRLSSRWTTLTFLHIVRLTQTFLLSLCFWLYYLLVFGKIIVQQDTLAQTIHRLITGNFHFTS